jgi:hypothetical protein
MKKILHVVIVLLPLIVTNSHAALLIDPYIGLNLNGSTKFGTAENDYKNSPVSLGARVGFAQLGFSVGLDYQITSGVEVKNDTNEYDSTEMAIFGGFDFPILVRAYAGYIVSADFESTASKYDEGSGYKLGAGFTGLPFISLNVEYKVVSYDKLNGVSTSTADNKSMLVGVSLPLKFF